jgi:foldase protein PrsA
MSRRVAGFIAAILAAPLIVACGSTARDSSPVVARVGTTPIGQQTLAHWIRAMAPEHIAPGERRQRALAFLISSQWLIGEAASEGAAVSRAQVARRLAEKERSFPSGRGEFEQFLRSVGRTVADQELELEAELAVEAIRRGLAAREAKITPADIARHYYEDRGEYFVPEQRYFYIVENIPSAAEARKLMAEVKAGSRSLASLGLKESYPREPYASYTGEKRTIIEAIFKAAPHVLTGPIRLGTLYFLIEVTHITSGYQQSLAQVQSAISSQLASEQHQRALAAFTASLHSRWKARTDCRPGYIVPKCRQYTGGETIEEPALVNSSTQP